MPASISETQSSNVLHLLPRSTGSRPQPEPVRSNEDRLVLTDAQMLQCIQDRSLRRGLSATDWRLLCNSPRTQKRFRWLANQNKSLLGGLSWPTH